MSRIAAALAQAARAIEAVSDTPRLDAELLLAHALATTRERLLLSPPAGAPPDAFAALVARRASGEPVAYIVGRRDFWTISLEVGPGVLIPRPDSETLLDAAVTHFRGTAGPCRILDLGTGSGALLLAALDQWPNASGLGIDHSPVALDCARRNAARLGMAGRALFRLGDWGEGVDERFDLLLCNPPYVATGAKLGGGVAGHEPAEALFAGPDGLDALRRIVPFLRTLLAPAGAAIIEIGFDQRQVASELIASAAMESECLEDLGGRSRALLVKG